MKRKDNWYTPIKYINSVKEVMGEITLDPFSDEDAQTIVQAEFFFDEMSNAHDNSWKVKKVTKVFMNPPYSPTKMGPACNRFLSAWKKQEMSEAIVLVHNGTETKWFQNLLERSSAICITNHRISFWNNDDKKISSNTRGQIFLYFGEKHLTFRGVFGQHGRCLRVEL